MRKTLIFLVAFAALLTGCKKSSAPAPAASNSPADSVQKKMQDLAGSGATDCGRYKTQAMDQMKIASDCAMKAAQGKHPFYVGYDLPGLTIGVVGNGEGKLYAVQAQQADPAQPAAVASAPCPAELRVAQSGRVTCAPPGSMGMNMGGGSSPHGGEMSMPAMGGQSPHSGAMPMPPPGTPNPHGSGKTPPKQK